jgi:hypothetical protein
MESGQRVEAEATRPGEREGADEAARDEAAGHAITRALDALALKQDAAHKEGRRLAALARELEQRERAVALAESRGASRPRGIKGASTVPTKPAGGVRRRISSIYSPAEEDVGQALSPPPRARARRVHEGAGGEGDSGEDCGSQGEGAHSPVHALVETLRQGGGCGGQNVEIELLRLKIKELEESWDEEVRAVVQTEKHKWVAEMRRASSQSSQLERDKRAKRLAAKIGSHNNSMAMSICFGAWKADFLEERSRMHKMKKVVRRMKNKSVATSFKLWHLGTEDATHDRKLRQANEEVERHYRLKLYCGIADVPAPILDVGGAGRMEKIELTQMLTRAEEAERRGLEADERAAQLRRELDLARKSLEQKDAMLARMAAEKTAVEDELQRQREVQEGLEAELGRERRQLGEANDRYQLLFMKR